MKNDDTPGIESIASRARVGESWCGQNSGTEAKRPGRPATGRFVRMRSGRLQAIVVLADGTRKRWPKEGFPPGTTEAFAKDKSLVWSAEAQKKGLQRKRMAEPAGDANAGAPATCDAWVEKWVAERTRRGMPSASENAGAYRNHIRARLGHKHVREWTAEDLRGLVAYLDDKISGGDLKWKSAWNIWATASKMCADAQRSKLPELRCREDNPARIVAGPERGDRTQKQFLYPDELDQFLRCEIVPLHWRRLVAIAVYTFARDGELRALRWEDVDLDHGTIHIHRAIERRSGAVKGTKTRTARRIPIDANLMPLLRAMKREAGDDPAAPVVEPNVELARPFRMWLMRAGVTRPELHHATPTRKAMTFYDLRATGITWLAVAGLEPLRIMQRAGHTNFGTTMIYVRLAEELRRDFGAPFAPLPDAIINSKPDAREIARRAAEFRTQVSHTRPQPRGIWRKRTGIEPARDSLTAPHRF